MGKGVHIDLEKDASINLENWAPLNKGVEGSFLGTLLTKSFGNPGCDFFWGGKSLITLFFFCDHIDEPNNVEKARLTGLKQLLKMMETYIL